MSIEGPGFTVHDRRKVKPEEESTETKREAPPGGAGSEGAQGKPLPSVEFSAFAIGLMQMALVHLGEVPGPQGDEPQRDLAQARHVIDILDMLEAKTRGNLSDDEATLLQHLLSDLKLRYVRLAG